MYFPHAHIDAHGRANKCVSGKKKKLFRSEKQLLQIATVREIYIGARLRDPRYSIRIVNGDNAQ